MIEEIGELYDYNRWANRRVLDSTGELSTEEFTRDLGSSFPSVRDTLAHILAAEWIWLERWRGTSPSSGPAWQVPTHEELAAQWIRVEEEQRAFLDSLDEPALLRVVSYRTVAGDALANPLWQLMRHVVNHSSYHRGQVATLLRQLGKKPAGTDLILFYRQR